jgi:hypothetical protein
MPEIAPAAFALSKHGEPEEYRKRNVALISGASTISRKTRETLMKMCLFWSFYVLRDGV